MRTNKNKTFLDYYGKLIKTLLGEDAIYNLINSMAIESKYCSDMM